MKIFRIFLLTLFIFSALTLSACIEKPGRSECNSHTDSDSDGKCDKCEKWMTPACAECKDENGDEKCDACGADVAKAPCSECNDKDGDGKCDNCKKEVDSFSKNTILLVDKDGKNLTSKFNIVVSDEARTGDIMLKLSTLVNDLKRLGLTVTTVDDSDKKAPVQDLEVLIGYAENRGEEYYINRYDYGMEGYAIQVMGSKIVIVAGSDTTYSKAFEAFKADFLGITDSTKRLGKVEIPKDHSSIKKQDNYKVNKLTLNGSDIKGYTIAADKSEAEEYKAAKNIQSLLYAKTGYWLEIVPSAEADKSIIITLAAKTGGEGYCATFNGDEMEFVCEFPTTINEEIYDFFNRKLTLCTDKTLNFSTSDNYVKNVRDVYYEDFGAVGDGKVDDTEAIRACHEYANKGGHTVRTKPNQKYYIGPLPAAITIMTSVNWGDAKFILDDAKITPDQNRGDIFRILRDGSSKSFGANTCRVITEINEAGGLDKDDITKLDLGLGYPALLRVYNSNHKNYIRFGVNENDGSEQDELILVDAEGNIDPSTPFMYDYAEITHIIAYPIDDEPITIEGGVFETSPFLSAVPQEYTAYGRGLNISRSNVTVRNVKHYLVNEGTYNYNTNTGDYGCPYGGFYQTSVACNVLFDSCVMSGHVVYKNADGVGMGTYGISPSHSVNVIFRDCYQEDDNFFQKDGMSRWGVMGSSGSKNVSFERCKLTRFDAHGGIHNVRIIDSELKAIRVNGSGNFYMENSIMHSRLFFGLREDYGGYWNGNIILKNNTMICSYDTASVFKNTWYNHNFGYDPSMATSIVIDGLKIYKDKNLTPSLAKLSLFETEMVTLADKSVQDYFPTGQYYSDGSEILVANKNKIPSPERIIIRNCDRDIAIPDKIAYPWFRNTVIEINKSTVCTDHFDFDFNGHCDDCSAEFTCTNHMDINGDETCTWCGTDVEIDCQDHVDRDRTGHCDICREKYVCQAHTDENADHICDECKAPLCNGEHYSAKDDGFCDVCYEPMPVN